MLSWRLFLAAVLLALTSPASAQLRSHCNNAPALAMPAGTQVVVSNEAQLQQAVAALAPNTVIVLQPGTYQLSRTLYITKNNITIWGNSANCADVVLVGRGQDNPNRGEVEFGVWTNSLNLTVANLTIRDTWSHSVILNGGAEDPHLYNLYMINAGEQFIKGNPDGAGGGVDRGLVEYCVMEYTNGPPMGPHAGGTGYTNGLSIHTAVGWIIRDSVFLNFHTPDNANLLWNPAILMWNKSRDTIVERNFFKDVDRAISFGLEERTPDDHTGGVIRNNIMYQSPGLFSASRRSGSDALIIVWDSPNTKVYNNTIITNGNARLSVETRWLTPGAEIRNNLADAPLGTRQGGTYAESNNLLAAVPAMFVDAARGDFHLTSSASAAIDKAAPLAQVSDDFDRERRPYGSAPDIGADEFVPGGADQTAPRAPANLRFGPQ